jgi:hypothetical protein
LPLAHLEQRGTQKEPDANEENAGDEEKLKVVGMEALNKALGEENALRFLALFHSEPTCYVEISRMLYEGQSIEEIFKRAKEHWRG